MFYGKAIKRKANYCHNRPINDDCAKCRGQPGELLLVSAFSLSLSSSSSFSTTSPPVSNSPPRSPALDVASPGAPVGADVVEQAGVTSAEPARRSRALVEMRRRTLERIFEIAISFQSAIEGTSNPVLAVVTIPVVFAVAVVSLRPRGFVMADASISAGSAVATTQRSTPRKCCEKIRKHGSGCQIHIYQQHPLPNTDTGVRCTPLYCSHFYSLTIRSVTEVS